MSGPRKKFALRTFRREPASGSLLEGHQDNYSGGTASPEVDTVKSHMKFEIWQASDHLWYWHFCAASGEIIAVGKGYADRRDCEHVVNLVMDTNHKTLFICCSAEDAGSYSGSRNP